MSADVRQCVPGLLRVWKYNTLNAVPLEGLNIFSNFHDDLLLQTSYFCGLYPIHPLNLLKQDSLPPQRQQAISSYFPLCPSVHLGSKYCSQFILKISLQPEQGSSSLADTK